MKFDRAEIITGLFLIVLTGCSLFNKEEKTILAKVGDKVLTADKIQEMIPSNLPREDSLLLVEDYIKKWVKQELLIKKAEENLAPVMKDVTRELMEYRNSLIIYRYKNDLIHQKMDTVVTDREMEQYYDENRKNFNLSRNIVKAVYIKILKDVAQPNLVKSFCENTTQQGLRELKDFCVQYSKGYGIFIDSWVEFDVLLKNIPVEITDQQRFLERYEHIEHSDSSFYYFAAIKDYRLVNDYAPIEYVSDNIKSLILNKRKLDFLKKVEEDIYTEGLRNRKFIIYKNEKR